METKHPKEMAQFSWGGWNARASLHHARAHTGCLGKCTGRGGKETSRQGTVLYNTITQPGVNSISDQKSQFGRNLQCADKRWTSHAWSWDQSQVQEKSAHEDNTHKAPCSTRPSFPAKISWEKVSHFSYNHFFTSYFSSICNGIETRVRTCEEVQQLPESHYKQQVDSAVQFTVQLPCFPLYPLRYYYTCKIDLEHKSDRSQAECTLRAQALHFHICSALDQPYTEGVWTLEVRTGDAMCFSKTFISRYSYRTDQWSPNKTFVFRKRLKM